MPPAEPGAVEPKAKRARKATLKPEVAPAPGTSDPTNPAEAEPPSASASASSGVGPPGLDLAALLADARKSIGHATD